jgi:hypothetical protein
VGHEHPAWQRSRGPIRNCMLPHRAATHLGCEHGAAPATQVTLGPRHPSDVEGLPANGRRPCVGPCLTPRCGMPSDPGLGPSLSCGKSAKTSDCPGRGLPCNGGPRRLPGRWPFARTSRRQSQASTLKRAPSHRWLSARVDARMVGPRDDGPDRPGYEPRRHRRARAG